MMINRSVPFVSLSLWFLALLCVLSPFDEFRLETTVGCVLLSLGFGFTVLARGLKTGWSVPKSPVLLLAGAFLGWVIASVLWSDIKPVSLIFIGMFSVMFVIFLTQTISGDRAFYKCAVMLGIPVFALLGLWAIIQNFFLNEYVFGQARHPLSDPSSLGGLLCLPFLLSLAWMFGAQKKSHRIIAVALSILLMGGIFATVARGPIFALVPAIAAMVFMMWPQVRAGWKYGLIFLLGSAIIFAGLYFNPTKQHDLGQQVAQTVTFEGDISNGRFYLWRGTWDIIKERPLLGTGFGTHFLFLPEYKDPRYTAAVHHAHNDPLQFWSELGIMGPLFFYGLGIAGLIRTIRALKSLRPDQVQEKTMIAGGFAALTALIVQSHVSFLFYNLSILFVAGFVLALWFYGTRLALSGEKEIGTAPQESAGMINLIALSLPFLMIGGLFFSVMAGDYYTDKAEKSLAAQDMDGFVENINRSGHISNGMNYRSYFLAVNVPMTIIMSEGSSLELSQKQELYKQAAGMMETVLSINPRSDAAYFHLGKIQELVGKDVVPEGTPSREEYYKKALAMDSMNLPSRLALMNLYKEQGRSADELLEIMTPAENMFFNSPLALVYYQELSKLYVETGNYGKAQDVLQKVMAFKARVEASQKHMKSSVFETLLRDEGML